MPFYDPKPSFVYRVSPEIDPGYVAIHVSLVSRQRICRTNEEGEVCKELVYDRILGESNVSFHYLTNSIEFSKASYLKQEFHRWMPKWTLSVCDRLSQDIVRYAHRLALSKGGGAGIVVTASMKIDEEVEYQPQYFPANFDIDDDDDENDDDDDDDDDDDEDDEMELDSRGLSCGEINKLKTERFKNGGDQYVVCSICMEEFSHEVKIIPLPCSHTFHNNCLASWLKRNASCPLCRFDITRIYSIVL